MDDFYREHALKRGCTHVLVDTLVRAKNISLYLSDALREPSWVALVEYLIDFSARIEMIEDETIGVE